MANNTRDLSRKRFCSRACCGLHLGKTVWQEQRDRMMQMIKLTAANPAVSKRKGRRGRKNKRWCRVKRTCNYCSKTFYATRYKVAEGNARYCSRKCFEAWQSSGVKQQPKHKKHCEICNREMWLQLHRLKVQRFCSRRCTAIYAAFTVSQRKSDTGIERKIEALLKELVCDYNKQVPLLGLTLVDFLVAGNLVIYADGTFWHSKPKRKQQDAFVTRRLIAAGYRVLRFTEEQIDERIETVKADIQKELSHAGTKSIIPASVGLGSCGSER